MAVENLEDGCAFGAKIGVTSAPNIPTNNIHILSDFPF